AILRDRAAPPELVLAALEAATILRSDQTALAVEGRLFDPHAPIRAAALAAYAQVRDDAVTQQLPRYLDALSDNSSIVRQAALIALRRIRQTIADEIIELHRRRELSEKLRVALREVFRDSRTGRFPERFAFLDGAAVPLGIDEYRAYAAKHRGDAVRGRTVYYDTRGVACAKCHSIAGQGGKVGPDLAGIGARQSRDELMRSILEPSSRVAAEFAVATIRTQSGGILQGVVRGESADHVELIDAEGRTTRVERSDIELRQVSRISMMPNGLKEGLTFPDFVDVIAFLETLRDLK
ncbi:MAG: c-type cytochrome, partial [Pirellulales bacterium]